MSREWVTKDKRRIPVSEMETAHIVNAMRMIKTSVAAGRPWRARWFPILLAELLSRDPPRAVLARSKKVLPPALRGRVVEMDD